MDILEQAEQAAKSGSNLVKAELLKSVPAIISELENLTKFDDEFNNGRYSASFDSEVIEVMQATRCDRGSAMIYMAGLWLFLMLNDCDNYEHYQAVIPSWIREWYTKAEAWNCSKDGLIAAPVN